MKCGRSFDSGQRGDRWSLPEWIGLSGRARRVWFRASSRNSRGPSSAPSRTRRRLSGPDAAGGRQHWPEVAASYFGEANECDMVPQLALSPRLFFALQQEDCRPLVELLSRIPDSPEGCQWVTLLRNHDELTLSLATDEERDYLFQEYASESSMLAQWRDRATAGALGAVRSPQDRASVRAPPRAAWCSGHLLW